MCSPSSHAMALPDRQRRSPTNMQATSKRHTVLRRLDGLVEMMFMGSEAMMFMASPMNTESHKLATRRR